MKTSYSIGTNFVYGEIDADGWQTVECIEKFDDGTIETTTHRRRLVDEKIIELQKN
jgi:hypothetical protein